MGDREDALEELEADDVPTALRWAHRSAYGEVLRSYNPATGHSQAWFGITAHTLMCDRLDRVFSCGKYAVHDTSDTGAGLDVLTDGLAQDDLDSMPR